MATKLQTNETQYDTRHDTKWKSHQINSHTKWHIYWQTENTICTYSRRTCARVAINIIGSQSKYQKARVHSVGEQAAISWRAKLECRKRNSNGIKKKNVSLWRNWHSSSQQAAATPPAAPAPQVDTVEKPSISFGNFGIYNEKKFRCFDLTGKCKYCCINCYRNIEWVLYRCLYTRTHLWIHETMQ